MWNTGVLTVSDKGWRGQREDQSGEEIKDLLSRAGMAVVRYGIVPDEADMISARLIEWADGGEMDLILTTGGTGLSPRDVTPEATLAVVNRVVPGLGEAMRARTSKTAPFAILSRGTAGVRGKCLIVNLPGSPRAVRECLEVILPVLPHALEIMTGAVTEHAAGGHKDWPGAD